MNTNATPTCAGCGQLPKNGTLRHIGELYVCSSGACSDKLIELVRVNRTENRK